MNSHQPVSGKEILFDEGNPSLDDPAIQVVEAPLVVATEENFKEYGTFEESYDEADIRIVTWPAPGWRQVDPGTGDEGGITQGAFECWWEGQLLRARNMAVGGNYVCAWCADPGKASVDKPATDRSRIYLRHANYHPDGSQLFCPRNREPFVAPLALPGDDVKPQDFVAFYCDGSFGINIHAGIWHEAVFPLSERSTFDGKQGKVHARISCDFVGEFSTYLAVPMRKPS